MPERTLIDVAALEELAPGEPVLVEVEGTPVALVNVDGEVLAVHDVCTHALESLSGGWVEGERIECPRHGAAFSRRRPSSRCPPSRWRSGTAASSSIPPQAMITR